MSKQLKKQSPSLLDQMTPLRSETWLPSIQNQDTVVSSGLICLKIKVLENYPNLKILECRTEKKIQKD